MKKKLTINQENFYHVKTREYTPVSIYKSENSFLRIGPTELIKKELARHRELLEYKFPVAQLLAEGVQGDRYYYIEKTMGDVLLSDIFAEDCREHGRVSDEHFADFLKLIESFAQAQLATVKEKSSVQKFYDGIHIDYLIEERPQLDERVKLALGKITDRIFMLPAVLTHGDFNLRNIFPAGIIDFENMFYAPAGYDLVCLIYHTYYFPKAGDYEHLRRYEFTSAQIAEFFERLDALYVKSGLPPVSDFVNEFLFARTVWAVVRMDHCPKMQHWRYEMFDEILDNYLAGQPVAPVLLT